MSDGNDRDPQPRSPGPAGPSRRGGGIPDGLLVGVLGLLLGITLLVWTGTGLAALLAHGQWPDHLAFTHSPMALRSLLMSPGDVAGAWPDVPAEQLPRPGLLFGILVSQVLVLAVLGIAVTTSVVRRRARRRLAREAHRSAAQGPVDTPSKRHPPVHPERTSPSSLPPTAGAVPPLNAAHPGHPDHPTTAPGPGTGAGSGAASRSGTAAGSGTEPGSGWGDEVLAAGSPPEPFREPLPDAPPASPDHPYDSPAATRS